MARLVRRLGELLACSEVKFLKKNARALPTQGHELATKKRIRFCETHLREGTNWRFSKHIMEVRLMADERLQLLTKCARSARRAKKFNPDVQLPKGLATRLARPLGQAPSNFHEVMEGFTVARKTWKNIVADARQIRNPLFASQVLFRLSEHNRLEIASLVIGVLIAAGAVQMLFFYGAAVDRFVFAYWTWDDLVIQAINVAPIAVIVLVASELLFRLVRWTSEKSGRLGPVLMVLHHPTLFALSLFAILLVSASYWGHRQGTAEWSRFAQKGRGEESATMLDKTHLTGVHLVGTTSRTAIFLQSETAETEEGGTSPASHPPINRTMPSYSRVWLQVVCTQPLPLPSCKANPPSGSGYRVYVIDRDKIVCHAAEGLCEGIPPRRLVKTNGDDG